MTNERQVGGRAAVPLRPGKKRRESLHPSLSESEAEEYSACSRVPAPYFTGFPQDQTGRNPNMQNLNKEEERRGQKRSTNALTPCPIFDAALSLETPVLDPGW